MDCIFCKIASKVIPANIEYEDGHVLAFPDINPVSPIHFLIIPKKHSKSIMDMSDGEMLSVKKAVKELAIKHKLEETGFRLVTNYLKDGGQEVEHVHFHFLAGRKHTWPPG